MRRVAVQGVITTNLSADQVRKYIEIAVKTWKGSLPPEDPLRDLEPQDIVVGPPLVLR
jgi:hypothetical protein